MTLETIALEEERIIFSREKTYEFEVPIVDIYHQGICIVRYVPLGFKTLEFYGEVYHIN